MGRDFLIADPVSALGGSSDLVHQLLGLQNNYLEEIALYLRRQNADVLCSAVVKGTAQQGATQNNINDNNPHEVVFEVGGKPVEIYDLLAYSTFTTGTVGLSVLSMSKVTDGIPFVAGTTFQFSVPVTSLWIQTAAVVSVNPLVVNGPANAVVGGFFLYGFTIPDWDRIRNSIRSQGDNRTMAMITKNWIIIVLAIGAYWWFKNKK